MVEFLEKNPRMFPNLKKGIIVADHNTGEKYQISKDGAISVKKSNNGTVSEVNKQSVTSKKSAKDIR